MPRPPILAPERGETTLKERRWGGQRLTALRGEAPPDALPIGESWEFSTLEGSESRALGEPLSKVLGHPLPFLVKPLDTRLPLSLQVHPDDDPVTGASGKEEAWIVLDADPGSEILVGIREGVSDAELAEATRAAHADPEGAGPRLMDLFARVEAIPGAVVLVPARTPHAIGGGILLAEIQQAADCTYRLFDYGSGRPVHVEQALTTIDVTAKPGTWRPGDSGEATRLEGKHVRLEVLDPASAGGVIERTVEESKEVLVVPALGEVTVAGPDGAQQLLKAGDLRLLADGRGTVRVTDGGLAVLGTLD